MTTTVRETSKRDARFHYLFTNRGEFAMTQLQLSFYPYVNTPCGVFHSFVMSSRPSNAIPLSKGQPIPWRIIDPGVCVEGQCLHGRHSCRAYGKMVIGNFQMGQFAVSSSHVFPCPECGGRVYATKLGLNRCRWRAVRSDKWNTIRDSYQTFDLSASLLRIETLPLEKSDHFGEEEDCTICMSSMDKKSECSILPCEHIFHTKCIHRWIDAEEETSLQCPVCRRPIFE